MNLTAVKLARMLGGLAKDIVGDPDRVITRVSGLKSAKPGHLVFLKASTSAITNALPPESRSGLILLCSAEHGEEMKNDDLTLILSDNPRLAFLRSVESFFKAEAPGPGIHPSAVIHPEATVHQSASIGAFCYVGAQCTIGAQSILHPHVTLVQNVALGDRVTINSGTVIGADGFGYERNEEGILEKFPHLGGVRIENDVEIGSNTSIDRGTLDDTIIRASARIDNQVHISHNVDIGSHSAVIAQSMVGGSASIGASCWLAPASVVINQARIGERATVGLGAVVVKDVQADATVMGSPAVPAEEFRLQRARLKSLLQASEERG